MAKRRSKQTRIQAQRRRKQQNRESTRLSIQEQKLFAYDPQLIKQDLFKTLRVTVVVLLVLALISLSYT